ncbi:MAG: TIGR04002 family protein [Lachnospiraceae bacterium]|nr:TIGR04002 family protein [Lachnospiraceae bacterium]
MNVNRKLKNLTITGIMAALITLMTAYICHIPMGANGAYIHFGDALIYLAAAILPKPYALAAAAIGGGLADLLTAPMWAPATVIIKMLIVLPFTEKKPKIVVPRNVFAAVIGYLFTGVGYFLAEYVLFENPAVLWVSLSQNLVQSVGSAVLFVVFGLALDKVQAKTKFF